MTGPVTTEALVAELAEAMLRHEWPNSPLVPFAEQDERIRNYWLGHARAQIAGPLAPLLAALQQVTAERDDWHAAADSATALNKEAVAVIARLRAEGEAPKEARRPPFNMDPQAQAAVLADLPPSVAQEAGEFYENAGGGEPVPKREAMAIAWASVLRPYLIGFRDHCDAQARPSTSDARPTGPAQKLAPDGVMARIVIDVRDDGTEGTRFIFRRGLKFADGEAAVVRAVKAINSELDGSSRCPAAKQARSPWSFNMEAAPRDGTPVDLWCYGRRRIDYFWDAEGRLGGWWSDARDKDLGWRDRECVMPSAVRAWRLSDAPPPASGEEPDPTALARAATAREG